MTNRVFVTATWMKDWGRNALELLKSKTEVKLSSYGRVLTESELINEIQGMDAVIIADEPFSAKVINATDKLKIIAREGVGYDNVDVSAATRRNILVTLTPVLHEAVADLTFGLIIAVVRGMMIADKSVKSGEWPYFGEFVTHDVSGSTLGIIGLGRIGSCVARRAKCFSMKVLYYDVVRNKDLEKELEIKYVSFYDLLKNSDTITIHTPLTKKTERLIGEKEVSLMKDGAYLINTSRGGVVDENALYKALKTGKLAGAGLDVLTEEPPSPDNPLLKLPNVVITPHSASMTVETLKKVAFTVVEEVISVLEGRAPRYALNPEALKTRS